MRILCSIMLSFRQACKINKGIKPTQKQQAFCKTYFKVEKHFLYIKLGLTLQSLTTLKMGELLLTVNSPKLGFQHNSES